MLVHQITGKAALDAHKGAGRQEGTRDMGEFFRAHGQHGLGTPCGVEVVTHTAKIVMERAPELG